MLIDEKLLWDEHIQYVTNKLIKYSSIFYKLRTIVPLQVLKTLYFALVHPHLLYGVELFGNAPLKYLDPLIKLNNKLLRIGEWTLVSNYCTPRTILCRFSNFTNFKLYY